MLEFDLLEERVCPKGYPGVGGGSALVALVEPSAVFNGSILAVKGNAADNTIVVSADDAGNLLVTVDGVNLTIKSISAVAPTTANTTLISIKGGRGADIISTDRSLNVVDANGVLVDAPDALLAGGQGDDSLTVGHGGIVGGAAGLTQQADGSLLVTGRVVGNAVLQGGQGDDVMVSGLGNDVAYGGKGDDTFTWLPGTLTDFFAGGKGSDSAVVVGNNNGGDAFTLSASDSDSLFQRTNLVQFSVLGRAVEQWSLLPGDGDDSVTINSLVGTGVKSVSADGGAGTDSLTLNNVGVNVIFANFEAVSGV